jgi:hypothetical protein
MPRAELSGIDHTKLIYRHQGRDFRLTDVHGTVVKDILGSYRDKESNPLRRQHCQNGPCGYRMAPLWLPAPGRISL